ncbi:uncharacterized protein MEPE_04853 [Melanopsichium pennsylvanicum]|uniref:NAD-dependent epimerase/dehydratase domain-containing protein n=2 Tax=Melanopsichium pennsylvanicum TaxID=63383 RepID=A0AAJ5C754_9BASI|nr:uncharacterized protein BN887_00077 [Melanopsichium pennsylvanicum 4]SNX86144.1 uncharacterized protein MEPE_04853 [Melanopsichium pennsylvanicum]
MSSEDSLYLVTGANGFIASALTEALVERGEHVRATVRRASAGSDVVASIGSDAKGTLEIAIVPDISAEGAFKRALQGVTHVFHMASPIPGAGKTDARADFLDPALAGTLSLLKDAKLTSSVRKVVLTSSVASILSRGRDNTGGTFTEDDWNPVTYNQAVALGELLHYAQPEHYMQVVMAIYAASKKVAEKASWDFVKEHKPNYVLTAVHPALVVGKTAFSQGLAGSNAMFWNVLNTRPLLPESTRASYVDLEDVVQGHIQAMDRQEANGKRFLLVGGQPMNHELVNWAKQHKQDLPFDRVEVPKDEQEAKASIIRFDTTASQKVLGLKYKNMQQTVTDFVDWASQTQPRL